LSQPEEKKVSIAGFQLLSQVGQGGMGTVYRARQESMDRIVALKILPPHLAEDRRFVDRFFSEARAAGKLDHPNIVRALDVGEADGCYYFAMEYVDGESASARLRRGQPLTVEEALGIAEQIAAALDHASARSIIHRDIKPGNILIGPHGTAKLADFGLARVLSAPAAQQHGKARAEGTPLYISPEQARADPAIDVRADIYSLGATLYHLLCGRPPFRGEDDAAILRQHLRATPKPVHERRRDVPVPFSHVIQQMLAKAPADRYLTPAALIEALHTVRRQVTPRLSPRRKASPAARRAPRRTAITVVIVLAVLAGAIGSLVTAALLLRKRPPDNTVTVAKPTPPVPLPTPSPPSQQPSPAQRTPPPLQAAAERIEQQLAALETVQNRARALSAERRSADALRELGTFPLDLRDRAIDQQLSDLRDELAAAARQHALDDSLQFDRLIQQGKLDAALALVQRRKPHTPPPFLARLLDRERALKHLMADHDRAARRAATQQYQPTLIAAFSTLGQRRFPQAQRLLADALADPRFAPIRKSIEQDARLCQDVAALFGAAEHNAQALIGSFQSLRGYRGQVTRVENGLIYLKTSKVEIGLKILTLPAEDVVRLSTPPTGQPTSAWYLGVAALWYAEEKSDAALAVLDKAQAAAVDLGPLPSRFDELQSARREMKAKELFAGIDPAVKTGRWKTVGQVAGQLLEEYPTTTLVQDKSAELAALKLQARLGGRRLQRFFHGRLKLLADDRIELLYDFSTRAQFDDWKIDVPRGDGDATVTWGKGAATLACSGYREMRYGVRRGAPMFILPMFLEPETWSVEAEMSVEGAGAFHTGLMLWDGKEHVLLAGFQRARRLEFAVAGSITGNRAYKGAPLFQGARRAVLRVAADSNGYLFTLWPPGQPHDGRRLDRVRTRDRFPYVGFLARTQGSTSRSRLTIKSLRLTGRPDPAWFKRAAAERKRTPPAPAD